MTIGCKSKTEQQTTETGVDSDVSLKRLADERAVSPVIGVILMVAITVILAAVIATFVLGIGSGQEDVPRVKFEFNETKNGSAGNPDEWDVIHKNGDKIDPDNLYISIEGTKVQHPSGSPTSDKLSWSALGFSEDEISAGDSVKFEPENSKPQINGRTIKLIWETAGSSEVIYEWEAPPED